MELQHIDARTETALVRVNLEDIGAIALALAGQEDQLELAEQFDSLPQKIEQEIKRADAEEKRRIEMAGWRLDRIETQRANRERAVARWGGFQGPLPRSSRASRRSRGRR